MNVVVFCGPTISHDEASRILKADFRPPIKHGELISCVYNDNPDVIVIIDGAFIDDLSVWHSEITEALNKGVKVYGSSAIGAIRAAEMKRFGMLGIGEVYRLFQEGELEADDEIFCDCVTLNGSFHRKTISVVNLRYILSDAADSSIISDETTAQIISQAKKLFYKERSVFCIISGCLEKGIINKGEADELLNFISLSQTDIQKNDAFLCLEAVKRLKKEEVLKNEKGFEYDLFFEALYERDRGAKNDNGHHPFFKIANDYAIYSDDIEHMNDAALNRKICGLVADNYRIEATEDEILSEARIFLSGIKIDPDYGLESWLKENDLTMSEFRELMAERVKIIKLQNWYRTRLGFAKNTRYLLEELKLKGQYVAWKNKSMDIEDKLKDHDDKINESFNSNELNKLTAFFLKRNSRPWEEAPFVFINKIGMGPMVFKNLLARDKVLSDLVSNELFNMDQ